jgi:hypothetical protein
MRPRGSGMWQAKLETITIKSLEWREQHRLVEFEDSAPSPRNMQQINLIDRATCGFIRALHSSEVSISSDIVRRQQ